MASKESGMADPMLPHHALHEIARRRGRGWYWSEKPKPAQCLAWQNSRIANYVAAMNLVPIYAEGSEAITKRTRDAVWVHVCLEVDIRWRKDNPTVVKQPTHNDPEIDEAFLSWAAHRTNGGSDSFKKWCKDRLIAEGVTHGTNP